MRPKNQNRRLGLIVFFGCLLFIGAWLVFSALQKSTQFFYDPSEILGEGFIAKSEEIKIGGLVVPGSVKKDDGITTVFSVADFPKDGAEYVKDDLIIQVEYSGVLPDLFAEGDGVVVTGLLLDRNYLKADDVLAKHDENYQPVK